MIKGFFSCAIYLIILGTLCFPFGRLLKKHDFNFQQFPFASFSFERDGKVYEQIGIRKWQKTAPDISRMAPSVIPKKAIDARMTSAEIYNMIQETCVAEVTHVLLCIAAVVPLWIWPGVGGTLFCVLLIFLLGTFPSSLFNAITGRDCCVINGRRLKSFLFTTDLAIIRNCDADAVFAVYPFTPQQAISEAIIKASYIPVFCGVGGGTTKGVRSVGLAKDAEGPGAMGVVLNAPISNPNLRAVATAVDIPVVIKVVTENTNIARRLDAGATIINVAGAADTPKIVRQIRAQYPNVPIIASGGKDNESIRETILAGANAITYTPPSTKELFRVTMSKYRDM